MTDELKLFERAVDQQAVALSEAGQARRAAMRVGLVRSVVTRRRRRVTVRTTLGLAVLAVLAGLWWSPPDSGGSVPGDVPIARFPDARSPGDAVPLEAVVDIAIVRDAADAMVRFAAPPVELQPWLDDVELLALLASVDRTTGLIRTLGRVILTRDVVDDWEPPAAIGMAME